MHNDHKVKPLHIMLPKVSAYVKGYDGLTKWMYFLLKMMTFWDTFWDKRSTNIKKRI